MSSLPSKYVWKSKNSKTFEDPRKVDLSDKTGLKPEFVDSFTFLNKRKAPVEIKFLLGDLTAHEEKVDLLVISCVWGAYAATGRSVIGALDKIGVNVEALAKDKEEDLRESHSCWISKDIDDQYFKKLLVFEASFGVDASNVVGGVFRGLIAMAPDCKSIIMPILSAQSGLSTPTKMLEATIRSCVAWCRRGLGVESISIVMYQDSPTLRDTFTRMKETFGITANSSIGLEKGKEKEKRGGLRGSRLSLISRKTKRKEQATTSDQPPVLVILSSENDKSIVKLITQILELSSINKFKIVEVIGRKDKHYNLEDTEQVLQNARKVIAILTPEFIQDPYCIDNFNVSVFMAEGNGTNKLIPLFVKQAILPKQMTLLQYEDARPGTVISLFPAVVKSVMDQVEMVPQQQQQQNNGNQSNQLKYDVFVSYSQAFCQQANAAKELLDHFGLNCFVDRNNLRTGGQWQKTLYDAIENSTIILCLLSPSFFTSNFCQDELALAKLLHDEKRAVLVPYTIMPWEKEAGKKCPEFIKELVLSGRPLYDCCEHISKLVVKQQSAKIKVIRTQKKMNQLKVESLDNAIEKVLALLPYIRKLPEPVVIFFGTKKTESKCLHLTKSMEDHEHFEGQTHVVSFAENDLFTDFIEDFESSTLLVPMLDDTFIQNKACMQALHMSLFRNRTETRCLVPLIFEELDCEITPTFVRLIPALFVSNGKTCDYLVYSSILATMQNFDDFQTLQSF